MGHCDPSLLKLRSTVFFIVKDGGVVARVNTKIPRLVDCVKMVAEHINPQYQCFVLRPQYLGTGTGTIVKISRDAANHHRYPRLCAILSRSPCAILRCVTFLTSKPNSVITYVPAAASLSLIFKRTADVKIETEGGDRYDVSTNTPFSRLLSYTSVDPQTLLLPESEAGVHLPTLIFISTEEPVSSPVITLPSDDPRVRPAIELANSARRSLQHPYIAAKAGLEDLDLFEEDEGDDDDDDDDEETDPKAPIYRWWLRHALEPKRAPYIHAPGCVGLTNSNGVSCYANAVVQCIAHTTLFRRFLTRPREDWHHLVNRTNVLGSKGRVAESAANLLSQLWQPHYIPQSSTMLHRAVSILHSCFSELQQQDAQDFLAAFLDDMHEDFNEANRIPVLTYEPPAEMPLEEVAHESWCRELLRNRSFVIYHTMSLLKSTYQGRQCKHGSSRFEPYNQLTLELPHSEQRELLSWIFVPYDCPQSPPILIQRHVPALASIETLKPLTSQAAGREINPSCLTLLIGTCVSGEDGPHMYFEPRDRLTDPAIKVQMLQDRLFGRLGRHRWPVIYETSLEPCPEGDIPITFVLNTYHETASAEFQALLPLVITLPFTMVSSHNLYQEVGARLGYERNRFHNYSFTIEGADFDETTDFRCCLCHSRRCTGCSLHSPFHRLVMHRDTVQRFKNDMERRLKHAVLEEIITGEEGDGREESLDETSVDPAKPLRECSPHVPSELSYADLARHFPHPLPPLPPETTLCDAAMAAALQQIQLEAKGTYEAEDADTVGLLSRALTTDKIDWMHVDPVLRRLLGNNAWLQLLETLGWDDPTVEGKARQMEDVVYDLLNAVVQSMAHRTFSDFIPLKILFREDSSVAIRLAHCCPSFSPDDLPAVVPTTDQNGFLNCPGFPPLLMKVCPMNEEHQQRSDEQERAVHSIYSCLESFTAVEELDSDNSWYCPDCRTKVRTKKRVELWGVPNLFFVHLKRFASSGDGCSLRLRHAVDFPFEGFDLSRYLAKRNVSAATGNQLYSPVTGPAASTPPPNFFLDSPASPNSSSQETQPSQPARPPLTKYRLQGIVCHHGPSLEFGHYSAFCYHHSLKQWFHYDDERVTPSSPEAIRSEMLKDVYLLVYSREDYGEDHPAWLEAPCWPDLDEVRQRVLGENEAARKKEEEEKARRKQEEAKGAIEEEDGLNGPEESGATSTTMPLDGDPGEVDMNDAGATTPTSKRENDSVPSASKRQRLSSEEYQHGGSPTTSSSPSAPAAYPHGSPEARTQVPSPPPESGGQRRGQSGQQPPTLMS